MPTITVRRLEYNGLKAELTREDGIVILSCDGCARESNGLGGTGGLTSLADKLVADGFNVVRRELLPVACSPEHLRVRLHNEDTRKLREGADVIIPLSCRAGASRATELLPGIEILRVTETLGRGTYSPETCARLTEPGQGVEIEIDDVEGILVADAAARLGLYAGSF